MILSFACPENMVGLRLDKALALREEIETRSRAAHLIDSGLVQVNGRPAKSSLSLKSGDLIEIRLPEPEPTALVPYDYPLDVLFEDEDLIVLNKPSGLVVHPAAGHAQDTLVNALLHHTQNLSMKFGEQRPGIVHRLDKETSGVLVVAKNDRSHEHLTRQFKERSIHRIYFAVTLGSPQPLQGVIRSYLARHPTDRKRYASVKGLDQKIQRSQTPIPSVGKWAVTHYQILKTHGGLSYCQLKLETGRTHQIRVHLSEQGVPIAGDTLYGAQRKIRHAEAAKTQSEIQNLDRFLLHAAELGFQHPRSGENLFFKAEWPENILSLLKSWRLK